MGAPVQAVQKSVGWNSSSWPRLGTFSHASPVTWLFFPSAFLIGSDLLSSLFFWGVQSLPGSSSKALSDSYTDCGKPGLTLGEELRVRFLGLDRSANRLSVTCLPPSRPPPPTAALNRFKAYRFFNRLQPDVQNVSHMQLIGPGTQV